MIRGQRGASKGLVPSLSLLIFSLFPALEAARESRKLLIFWFGLLRFCGTTGTVSKIHFKNLFVKYKLRYLLLSLEFFFCGSCLLEVRIIIMYMLNLDLIFALRACQLCPGELGNQQIWRLC